MDVITIKTTFNKYIFQKYYKIRNFWGDLAPEIFIKKDIALSEVTFTVLPNLWQNKQKI